jgi:hypothetical protein
MESSEIFLMVWAIVATILAVVFKHLAHRAHKTLLVFQLGLMLLAEGRATVYKDGDKVGIKSC